jgi:hypothetical protein
MSIFFYMAHSMCYGFKKIKKRQIMVISDGRIQNLEDHVNVAAAEAKVLNRLQW